MPRYLRGKIHQRRRIVCDHSPGTGKQPLSSSCIYLLCWWDTYQCGLARGVCIHKCQLSKCVGQLLGLLFDNTEGDNVRLRRLITVYILSAPPKHMRRTLRLQWYFLIEARVLGLHVSHGWSEKTKALPSFDDKALNSLAERTGLEPATPGVTGRYSNQLNYRSATVYY